MVGYEEEAPDAGESRRAWRERSIQIARYLIRKGEDPRRVADRFGLSLVDDQELLVTQNINVLAEMSDDDLIEALENLRRMKEINPAPMPAPAPPLIEHIDHVNGNGRADG